MGIIVRFKDIIEANVNALIDKCEDPAKMIDQTLRDLYEDLAKVKEETAGVMAEEKNAKRQVDKLKDEVARYDSAARKAITASNDSDARALITKKQSIEANLITATNTYNVAKANADKMKQMHDKLTADITSLNAKRENIKSQVAMAKAQERVNSVTASMNAQGAMDSFVRMEAKAQKMLDSAMAEAELNGTGMPIDDTADLADKYNAGVYTGAVDDELEKLKAEMGLSSATETGTTSVDDTLAEMKAEMNN